MSDQMVNRQRTGLEPDDDGAKAEVVRRLIRERMHEQDLNPPLPEANAPSPEQ